MTILLKLECRWLEFISLRQMGVIGVSMSVIICPSCKLAFDCFDPIIPVFQILPLKYHTHIVFLTAIPSNQTICLK